MKLGLLVEVEEGLTWERWRTLFGACERLGFDSVWVSDHLCSASKDTTAGLDAWVALSVAAAETRRIELGTLVTPVTFRPAAIVARMAESLQALSGNRLTVGLGLGWNRHEHEQQGLPFPPASERARWLASCAEKLKGVAPLLIGGSGQRLTLPLVARWADEWNMTTSSADAFAERSAALDALCAAAGRDPATIRRSVATGLLVGRDDATVAGARRRLPPSLATTGWIVGSPELVVRQIRALVGVGVDRVMLGDYGQTDVAALEVIAAEVMPHLP
jgi:alkanesulfonate monooxygenase SsuD/methylene tetrahydromethanopterin reductase-like flavin-dependent oxidoreductase (luciferase family)